MSVEVRSSPMSVRSGPIGGGSLSNTEGSRGMGSSYKPMFSISKEGNMTKFEGNTMNTQKTSVENKTRITNLVEAKSGYHPLFSISKEGKLGKIGTLPKSLPDVRRQTQTLRPLNVDYSPFSLDTVATKPKFGVPEAQTYLYKRPSEFAVKPTQARLEQSAIPTIIISDSKGRVEQPKRERVTPLIKEEHKLEPQRVLRTAQVPSSQVQKTSSPWERQQDSLLAKRNRLVDTNITQDDSSTANKQPDIFASTLQRRVHTTEKNHIIVVNPKVVDRPSLQALETRVQTLKSIQTQIRTSEVIDTASKIKKAAEMQLGKIDLKPDTLQRVQATATTQQQALLEITTKIQDGAIIARKMTEILISQGVVPKIAEEKAIEQTTQTLVRTLQHKKFTRFVASVTQDEKDTHQEEKASINTEQDLTKVQTQDQKDAENDVEGEIIPVRDILTDTKRVEVAAQIGSELLALAQSAGQSSINLSTVADFMPEQPGKALASYIRTQLELHLHSEEQYDAFNDTLSKMGTVSSEQEIIEAAKFATDQAPAVMLAKSTTAEKVTPQDVDSALKNGNPIRKIINAIKQTISQMNLGELVQTA